MPCLSMIAWNGGLLVHTASKLQGRPRSSTPTARHVLGTWVQLELVACWCWCATHWPRRAELDGHASRRPRQHAASSHSLNDTTLTATRNKRTKKKKKKKTSRRHVARLADVQGELWAGGARALGNLLQARVQDE